MSNFLRGTDGTKLTLDLILLGVCTFGLVKLVKVIKNKKKEGKKK